MFQTVDSILHSVLGPVFSQVTGHPLSVAMRLFNDFLAYRPLGADIDLEGMYSPPQHVVNEGRNLFGCPDRTADQTMIRWVAIHQSAAEKHSWGRIRMTAAVAGNE